MRNKIFCTLASFFALLLFALIPSHASAVSFNQNNIIDDAIFNDAGTMTAAQIDTFLNSFPSSCISPANGFTDKEPIGYTPSGGYAYGGNVSAGTIIYDVSNVYTLNPRVFLATLQKEQSLITGGAGCHYTTPDQNNTFQCNLWGTGNIPCTTACTFSGGCVPIALGNNCPGNCQASTEGFSRQIVTSAWKLKYWQQRSEGNVNWNVQVRDFPHAGNVWDNSDDVTPGSSTYCYSGLRMTQGFYKLCPNGTSATYDGYTTINSGGTTVHLDNGATAALYNFTPFTAGGQSFDNWFQTWFGPTSAYTYQFVSQGSSTGSFILGPNQSATFTLVVKNTSPVTWTNTGNPVKLAEWNPPYSRSPLDPGTWEGPYRMAIMSEASVAPGQNGTFIFPVKAPSSEGMIIQRVNLVMEGITWFQDPWVEFDVKVQRNLSYQMVSQSSSTGSFDLRSGQAATFTLVVKNVGNMAWDSNVKLATWAPSYRTSAFNDGTWPTQYRTAILQESSVAPGQNGTFVFNIRAPDVSASKIFYERFNLVMEGTAWFNDPWLEFDVNVKPAQYTYQLISQSSSSGSFVLSPNQQATFTLVVKNTGNVPWTNSGMPVKLATWAPSYSRSPYDPGTWENTYRAATLQEASVASGQNGTFVFAVKAPATTGNYYSRFNLVMEGVNWFTDPWLEFDVVVR